MRPFPMIRKLTNEGLSGERARKRALAWTTAAVIKVVPLFAMLIRAMKKLDLKCGHVRSAVLSVSRAYGTSRVAVRFL
jgi:hypothetical protein